MKYRMVRKRRRSALTDYKKRIELLKGAMPRVVVRKSNRNIFVQVVEFQPSGDKVITGVSSKELKAFGWEPRSNIPTAYLTGLLLAKKSKSEGNVVLDIGLYKPQKSSVIFAAAKGAADGGMKVINQIEFDAKKLSGGHIADYAKSIKSDNTKYNKQFSAYSANKFDPEKIHELFETAKKKILSK